MARNVGDPPGCVKTGGWVFFGLSLVLIVAIATVDWDDWWMPGAGIRVGVGELPTTTYLADLSRCLEVPETIRAEIQDGLLVGVPQTRENRTDQIQVEWAEPLEWAAIQGSNGSWIATRIDYAQTLSSPTYESAWLPSGAIEVTLLYFRSGTLEASGRVYRYDDNKTFFNPQISRLGPSPVEPSGSDLRAVGTCLECDPNTLDYFGGCTWEFNVGWQGASLRS